MTIHNYVVYDQCCTITCLIAKKKCLYGLKTKVGQLLRRAHDRTEAIGKPLHPMAESLVCSVLYVSLNQHHLMFACLRSGLPLK